MGRLDEYGATELFGDRYILNIFMWLHPVEWLVRNESFGYAVNST